MPCPFGASARAWSTSGGCSSTSPVTTIDRHRTPGHPAAPDGTGVTACSAPGPEHADTTIDTTADTARPAPRTGHPAIAHPSASAPDRPGPTPTAHGSPLAGRPLAVRALGVIGS